jgi:hypothetical protein
MFLLTWLGCCPGVIISHMASSHQQVTRPLRPSPEVSSQGEVAMAFWERSPGHTLSLRPHERICGARHRPHFGTPAIWRRWYAVCDGYIRTLPCPTRILTFTSSSSRHLRATSWTFALVSCCFPSSSNGKRRKPIILPHLLIPIVIDRDHEGHAASRYCCYGSRHGTSRLTRSPKHPIDAG